jgi:gliding motility-associated-like protein
MTAPFAVKTRILFLLSALCSLTAGAQLSANFTASPLSGCVPLLVNFTDLSTGNPTQWRWDLGNGTISFNQNPSASYFTPGQYTIKLVVHDAFGNSDSITRTQYISANAQPTVNFSGNPLTGCYPLPVQFTDMSTSGSGTLNSWQWDFGDGSSSPQQNPSHTYMASGNYNVTLQVTNSVGCVGILNKTQYVHINTGVHANFSNGLPSSCTAPASITFQNLSTGSGTLTYQWTFGDGGTSTATNPTHIYNAAGSYTVRLIVTNNTGCRDTLTRANAIVIGTVHAAFTCANSVCVNTPLTITNASVPVPQSVSWDFGDGTTSMATNPVKVYITPGPRVIRLIANFGACADTAYKTIQVLNKPAAAFTNSNPFSCIPPLTVNFTNSSPGFGYTYTWNFGDGSASTLPNPVHTYTAYGNFDVTLIVTNANGCSDTLVKTSLVKIQSPHVTIDSLPKSDCAPFTWHFTASVNAVDPVASYLWDFGDGNTSTLAAPTHTFGVGSYTIKLVIVTAGGCTDSTTIVGGIIASTKPVANFSATPRDVCAHVPVNFTDLSTGTVTWWQWSFGDGGISNQQNPVHLYEDTGYFTVQLIIRNNGCPDTIRFVNYIHINPPIANFVANFNCINPKVQTFTDQSIGADTWSWNFGDGGTSTLQNPVHTYASTGVFNVTLTVHNNTTGCNHTKTAQVNVIIEKAAFMASDTAICRNTSVSFSATGNNPANVASYNWDFGDGNTGTGATVNHTYTLSGSYNVRLIITDILNCSDTLVKPLYITVYGPTASFTAPTSSCLMHTIIFTDLSHGDGTNPIVSWTWDYGDGVRETLNTPPFQHTYTWNGIYSVSLKVTDSRGCTDSILSPGAVVVSKPVASFSSLDTLTCPAMPVQFSDSSSGPALTYLWDFGDGATSAIANPVHAYSLDGIYTVTLVVTNYYGCKDTMVRPAYIRVASPHAGFTMSDSLGTCPPLFVNFTDTSQNYIAVNWDFGDGTSTQSDNPSHFYTTPGTYVVKLTVTSIGGCVDSAQKNIVLRGPQGNFTYGPLSGCRPLTITFTASTHDRLSFIWDFNDGNIVTTTDSVIQHIYSIPGNYVPKMILVDPGGCQVPITGPDTIRVKGAIAKFGFVNQPICDAGPVSFTDSSSSNDIIVSYAWSFGDGGTSGIQNPTHFYASTGSFTPQLIVTTQLGCKDTALAQTPVKIVASPQAGISSTGSGCAPLTVNFNGILNVPDTSAINWAWNFGNGNTSNLQNPPPQTYNTVGTFNVQLLATNSSGCRDTVSMAINTYVVPTIYAGPDTLICRGTGTQLSASGGNTYTWSPTNGLSCTNCPNPIANPDAETAYVVSGTSLQGCSNTDTVIVKVKQRFVMNSSPGDTLCKGGSVRLFASGAFSYSWSPATGLNSTTSPSPLASPVSTTTYMVVGTDDRACFKDTGYVNVKVFPIPTVEAGPDKTIKAGQSVELRPTISSDVNTVLWIPTGSIAGSNFPAVTVKPTETTEYTVEVRNAGGCKAKDNLTIFVMCDGSNVFIPNTFSPNGDGVNDLFYPRGTGLFRIKCMRIFNRWGEVVFEKNDFTPNDASYAWNGTYQGRKLNPDVYVYTLQVICDNSTTLTFKGNVALIK